MISPIQPSEIGDLSSCGVKITHRHAFVFIGLPPSLAPGETHPDNWLDELPALSRLPATHGAGLSSPHFKMWLCMDVGVCVCVCVY